MTGQAGGRGQGAAGSGQRAGGGGWRGTDAAHLVLKLSPAEAHGQILQHGAMAHLGPHGRRLDGGPACHSRGGRLHWGIAPRHQRGKNRRRGTRPHICHPPARPVPAIVEPGAAFLPLFFANSILTCRSPIRTPLSSRMHSSASLRCSYSCGCHAGTLERATRARPADHTHTHTCCGGEGRETARARRRRGAAAANAHGGEALEATRADEGCRGRSGVLAASGRTTNANPAGFFATHTLDVGPNLCTSLSTSCWVTCEAGLGLLLGARLCARAEEGPACLRVEIPKVQPLALARHRWERCASRLAPVGTRAPDPGLILRARWIALIRWPLLVKTERALGALLGTLIFQAPLSRPFHPFPPVSAC